jgi:hypothetical protein
MRAISPKNVKRIPEKEKNEFQKKKNRKRVCADRLVTGAPLDGPWHSRKPGPAKPGALVQEDASSLNR